MTDSACFSGPLFMFDKDTAVRQVAANADEHAQNEAAGWPFTYAAHVTSNWDTGGHHPNGGYLVCIVLSALEKVLAHPHPLVLSSWFISGATAGRAFVKVKTLKSSGSRSSAEAILYQLVKQTTKDGHESEVAVERLRVTAMFTDLAKPNGLSRDLGGEKHPRHTLYPTLPPIDQCEKVSYSTTITRSIVGHYDPLTAPTKKGEHCERRMYMQFQDGRKPDVKSLALFADGSIPAVLTLDLPESWVPTIEYTVYFRGIPAAGPLKVFLQSRHLINGYVEEDFDILDSTDKLVAQSRQLALVLGAKKKAAL